MIKFQPLDSVEKNLHRFPCGPGEEPCYRCGRAVVIATALSVRVVDGGGSLAAKGEHVEEGGDLGLFSIGPSCAKKVPANYRH